jgi:hypothetical protein
MVEPDAKRRCCRCLEPNSCCPLYRCTSGLLTSLPSEILQLIVSDGWLSVSEAVDRLGLISRQWNLYINQIAWQTVDFCSISPTQLPHILDKANLSAIDTLIVTRAELKPLVHTIRECHLVVHTVKLRIVETDRVTNADLRQLLWLACNSPRLSIISFQWSYPNYRWGSRYINSLNVGLIEALRDALVTQSIQGHLNLQMCPYCDQWVTVDVNGCSHCQSVACIRHQQLYGCDKCYRLFCKQCLLDKNLCIYVCMECDSSYCQVCICDHSNVECISSSDSIIISSRIIKCQPVRAVQLFPPRSQSLRLIDSCIDEVSDSEYEELIEEYPDNSGYLTQNQSDTESETESVPTQAQGPSQY